MQFTQTRNYPVWELSYVLHYEIASETNDGLELSGQIELESSNKTDDVHISDVKTDGPLRIEADQIEGREYSFRLVHTGIFENGKFILSVEGNDGIRDLHIKLPPCQQLGIYEDFITSKVDDQTWENVDAFDAKDDASVFDLLDAASFALTQEEYLQFLDFLAGHSDDYQAIIHDQILEIFRNWIRGEYTGKQYNIDTISEYVRYVDYFNELPNTGELSETPEENLTVQTLVQDRGEIAEWILSQLGDSLELYSLSMPAYCAVMSLAVHQLNIQRIAESLREYADDDEPDEDIEDCLSIDDRQRKINCLRRVLPQYAKEEDQGWHDLRYGLSQLLYHYSNKSRIHHEDSPDFLARIYGAVVRLASESPFYWMAEASRYHRHMMLATANREESDIAIKHFDQAILTLTDSDEWNYSIDHWVNAVRRKTRHEVENLLDEDLFDEAVTKLAERANLVENVVEKDSKAAEYALDVFEGLQKEITAEQLVVQNQFERALELYNEAAGIYKTSNVEHLFQGVKGRRIQIMAFLAELNADFNEAADHHRHYAEELPASRGAAYHRIRSKVCLAKEAAIKGDYQQGIEKLEELEQRVGLNASEQQLLELLRSVYQYERGNIDDLAERIDSLILSFEGEPDRVIEFRDDYTTGFLTILAAQRLQPLPVPDDTLKAIVELAIEDACYPEVPPEQRGEHQRQVTVPAVGSSSGWELSLPSHILKGFDQLRIDRQTTFDDFSSLAQKLAILTEQLLAIMAEYYGKRHWGDDWEDHRPGEGLASINDLFQFFNTEAAEGVHASSEIVELSKKKIVGDELVKELRDALAHGRDPQLSEGDVTVSSDQFEQMYDNVERVMKAAVRDIPVIGQVGSQFSSDTYKIHFKWGGAPKQSWITTSAELEIDELYYFPRFEIGSEYSQAMPIDENSLIHCEEGRARSHLLERGDDEPSAAEE